MANMLSGSKIVEADCYCHRCGCCSRTMLRIKHVKRMARRKEKIFWQKDQLQNAG